MAYLDTSGTWERQRGSDVVAPVEPCSVVAPAVAKLPAKSQADAKQRSNGVSAVGTTLPGRPSIYALPVHPTAYDQAFSEAYATYYPKLFAFIYSRVRDVELTKDLVAMTMEKAYAKGHQVRDPSAYGGWLFMIAKNAMVGHFRSTKRAYDSYQLAHNELRFVDPTDDPEKSLLQQERAGELRKQMATLSMRDQELLSLQYDGELTNAEIGRITNSSAPAVRVAIFRALRRLKARMKKEVD
jgi:RNA polymerase sigma factor (sigma-70 family)